MSYNYTVHDGQFGFDFIADKLFATEDEVFILPERFMFGERKEIYILSIQDREVTCIGNVELSFPKNDAEKESLLNIFCEDKETIEDDHVEPFDPTTYKNND